MKLSLAKTLTIFLTLLALTFSAIGVTPVYADDTQNLARQAWSQSGMFSIMWGDSFEGASQTVYTLTDDSGQTTLLSIDEALAQSLGGVLSLNGKYVNVQGIWDDTLSAQSGPAVLNVTSISLAPLPGAKDSDVNVSTSAVTGTRQWVSILCKFSDFPTVEPNNLAYFQNMYPKLNDYWRELSYDTINITESNAVNWVMLPHPEAYYNPTDTSGGTNRLLLATDCIAAADASVDFRLYTGINMMFNTDFDNGWSWGGSMDLTLDGLATIWGVTWMASWGYAAITAVEHEMGHAFGLPHSSGNYGQVYDNAWDVMSNDWFNCAAATDPIYGCMGQHTIAYHKNLLGWLPPGQVTEVISGNATITLEQLALPQTGNTKMIKIGIRGSSTHFYTVEARRRTGFDSKLAGAAVIIHEVDTTRSEPAHVIDADGNGNTGDAGAMWTVGETFTDASGISVSVLSATASGFQLSIYAPLLVSTNADSGAGSLRQAILNANANGAGPDVITFNGNYGPIFGGGSNAIILASELPAVTSAITITAAGLPPAYILANWNSKVANYAVFRVDPAGDLNLFNIHVGNGGNSGIINNGTLNVTSSTISGNSATNGGGIYNNGWAIIKNSTLSGNTAADRGGGIYNNGSTVMQVTDSTLSYNTAASLGGGIYNDGGGFVNVKHSTLDGNTATNWGGGGIFNNNSSTVTVHTNSVISNNTAGVFGGGIYNDVTSTLNVIDSLISTNHATTDGGGGINNVNWSTANITNSTISGNTSATNGGGVFNVAGATLNLTNSTLSGNTAASLGGGIYNVNDGFVNVMHSALSGNSTTGWGGGIFSYSGTVSVTDSTLSGNSVTYGGGGIGINGGTLNLTSSMLSGNIAGHDGGGIRNYGTVNITGSTLTNNSGSVVGGGGVYNAGNLTVTASTFSGNTHAVAGGGIYNSSNVVVVNSTFSANSADIYGGGIFSASGGILNITNSTLSGNSAYGPSASLNGGGIYNDSGGTLNYANTIIANSPGGDCRNVATIGTNTNNLVQNGSCSPALSGDPNLGALASNGGPTQTFALLAGSPAIDAGNDAICAAAPVNNTSQNGITRPKGAHCDIGAYEYNDSPNQTPTDISLSNTNVTENQPVGTLVGNLSTTDPDAGDTHTYSFACTIPGANDASFSIVGNALNTAAIFDFATKSTYDICIRTNDGNGGTFDKNFTVNITVNEVAPTVVSSLRVNPDPTAKANIQFTVTFSKPVTGVDTADFFLTASAAVIGETVTTVTPVSTSVYTVTVNTGTGNGTIRLDIPIGATITDLVGNPLASLPFTGGEVYTVNKTLTFNSTGAQDGWILETGENTNAGGALNYAATTFNLGDDAAKKQYRGLLSFSTGASLPDDAVITKVTLKVKKSGVIGGGNPVTTFNGFMVDIKKGFFGTAALQASDFQAAANKTYGPFMTALSGGFYSLDLTSGKAYINKLSTLSGLTQIRLRFQLDDNNNAVANYLSLFSGNAPAGSRPQLIIQYYVP